MQNLFSRSEQTKKIKKMAGLAPSYWALQCPARLHGTNHCGKRRIGEDSNLLYAAFLAPRYQTCDHQSAHCLHSAAPIAAASGSKFLKWHPTYAIRKVEATH